MNKSLQSNSDLELVKMLREANGSAEAAFTELYQRHSSMVHAYCMRVMNHQTSAEDIFQETFIKFYQTVRVDVDHHNIPGFLLKIARNLCLNTKRDSRPALPITEYSQFVDTENFYEKKELLELITVSLDLLDFDFREAFVLKEYDGLTYEEIADVVGITVTNAKSRVHRAKIKLKEVLMPYLNDIENNN